MAENKRLDAYLVDNGYATGRDKAKELIHDGQVTVNGVCVTKPAVTVGETDVVECRAVARYVGRGGLKLEAALASLLPLPDDCAAMDVGASTGGFTQCMLQGGAAKVYAVDVGHGQLHPTLAADSRVVNLEGTDVRDREKLSVIPPHSIGLLAMDVSFISVRTVLPAVLDYLQDGARLLILIKPQFEAGRTDIGKNGIVRDRRAHVRVLREVCDCFAELGCGLTALSASPIKGGAGRHDGNIEYLAVLTYGVGAVCMPDLRRLVEEAFVSIS